MKFNVRAVIMLILSVILVVGIVGVVRQQREYRQGEVDYAQAAQLAGAPGLMDVPSLPDELPALSAPEVPPPPASAPAQSAPAASSPAVSAPAAPVIVERPIVSYEEVLEKTDLSKLQGVNSDVIGWIWIPGSALSYPLLQTGDNQYYLSHNWKKGSSSLGSVFLDCRNAADLSDFNTLIYGHRMRDNSMFGTLKHYQKQSYWEQCPSIYLLDEGGVHRYDIFAAYEADVDARVYTPGLTGEEEKAQVIAHALERSVIETGIVPTVDDRLLTLVTCTGRGYATRWLIQGVAREQAQP